jgi:hypothetical protein
VKGEPATAGFVLLAAVSTARTPAALNSSMAKVE